MHEESLKKLAAALESNNIPHTFVGIIPFSREITSNILLEGTSFIPYGSTLMVSVVAKLNWEGLHFNDNFDYEIACDNRDDMLNSSTKIMSVAKILKRLNDYPDDKQIFIRPSKDLKSFSGQVLTVSECRTLLTDAISGGSSRCQNVDENTIIVVAEPVTIISEWRWFIVDGKIVSGSKYRHNQQLVSVQEQDESVIKDAQRMADSWLPNACCVMDTALVGDKMFVIEFNCINASGFYDHDVEAIVLALWKNFNSTFQQKETMKTDRLLRLMAAAPSTEIVAMLPLNEYAASLDYIGVEYVVGEAANTWNKDIHAPMMYAKARRLWAEAMYTEAYKTSSVSDSSDCESCTQNEKLQKQLEDAQLQLKANSIAWDATEKWLRSKIAELS